MQAKVFILSFISAAKHRFWRTGDRLVEIQNIYVLCARVEAPLPSHLCLAHSIYKKKDRNGKEHPLSDAGPFCSGLSNQCKEQILMWSLH